MTRPVHSEVRVFAPATVANLGPGFDVLGLAMPSPGDTVTARRVPAPGVKITSICGDEGKLPRKAGTNTAGIAALEVMKRAGIEIGIELELDKGMPIGSGLGSSAASAAAAAVAVNLLLGSPLRKADLVEPCMEAEAAVSGRHADNVAPAILGGLIMVRSTDPLDLVRLPAMEGLTVAVVTPSFSLGTREAREVLPQEVSLAQLVRHSANVAGMISAFHTGDADLLRRSMIDEIVTPARVPLIPGCADVISAAMAGGALGSSISGAGPSVFALCRSMRSARDVSGAMARAFASAGLESTTVTGSADCPGARSVQ